MFSKNSQIPWPPSSPCRESEKEKILHWISKFAISYKKCAPCQNGSKTSFGGKHFCIRKISGLSNVSTLQTVLPFQPFVPMRNGK